MECLHISINIRNLIACYAIDNFSIDAAVVSQLVWQLTGVSSTLIKFDLL